MKKNQIYFIITPKQVSGLSITNSAKIEFPVHDCTVLDQKSDYQQKEGNTPKNYWSNSGLNQGPLD